MPRKPRQNRNLPAHYYTGQPAKPDRPRPPKTAAPAPNAVVPARRATDSPQWWKKKWRAARDTRMGSVFDVAVPLGVAILAGLSGFGIVTGKYWAAIWLASYLGAEIYQRYQRGGAIQAFANSVERVNGSIAGIVDTFALTLRNSHDQRVGEDQSRHICVSLLARIRDYAGLALKPADDLQLRVTLAVPYSSVGGGPVDSVRIWCYDQPYSNRRWSTFAMELPGAPEAFRAGKPQVIDDVNALIQELGIDLGHHRDYASVACLPVVAGGLNGTKLAVVNIDAKTPNFFNEDALVHQLLPLVAPVVNLIALVLLMRREEPYEFNR